MCICNSSVTCQTFVDIQKFRVLSYLTCPLARVTVQFTSETSAFHISELQCQEHTFRCFHLPSLYSVFYLECSFTPYCHPSLHPHFPDQKHYFFFKAHFKHILLISNLLEISSHSELQYFDLELFIFHNYEI